MITNGIIVCLSLSTHNWNTLFVGTNAVADAIAEKYNTTKSQVLDHVSSPPLLISHTHIFILHITWQKDPSNERRHRLHREVGVVSFMCSV